MLHTPWPQSFYSRILAPNRKELVSFIKDENAILHPDQEFIWGNDCLMEKKERLGDYDKILELLSPSLRLFWNEITRLTGVDIIDNLDKFISRNISSKEIIKYYFYTIPWFVSISLPMTLLMSTIITFISCGKSYFNVVIGLNGLG